MKVYVVTLDDDYDGRDCFVFSTEEKAEAFAEAQRDLGIWRAIDQYEGAELDDESEVPL